MNASTSILILVLSLTAALSANAAEPPQTPGIVIDCAAPALPSQQAVSTLTGIENYGQAYAVRSRLMQQGLRACKRGAKHVVIVSPVQARPEAPAVARVDR